MGLLERRGDLCEFEAAEIDAFAVVVSVLEQHAYLLVRQYGEVGIGGVEVVVRNVFEGARPRAAVVAAELDAAVAAARPVIGIREEQVGLARRIDRIAQDAALTAVVVGFDQCGYLRRLVGEPSQR